MLWHGSEASHSDWARKNRHAYTRSFVPRERERERERKERKGLEETASKSHTIQGNAIVSVRGKDEAESLLSVDCFIALSASAPGPLGSLSLFFCLLSLVRHPPPHAKYTVQRGIRGHFVITISSKDTGTKKTITHMATGHEGMRREEEEDIALLPLLLCILESRQVYLLDTWLDLL